MTERYEDDFEESYHNEEPMVKKPMAKKSMVKKP